MDAAAKKALIRAERGVLLGVGDPALAERLAREVKRFAGATPVGLASSLVRVRELAGRMAPEALLIDEGLVKGQSFADAMGPLTAITRVILLAPMERQAEAAALVASSDVEFVTRVGDFVPVAAALIERRLRAAESARCLSGLLRPASPEDLAAIFRHEINNPLTGILGNAELVLAHRERLAAVDAQRLQTVVDLCVRLRETIRRLTSAWEERRENLKSA